MGEEENRIQKQILEYLLALGLSAWRNNTAGIKKGSRFIRCGIKGSADIIAILPPNGRFLGIEVKVPGKKQSDDQIDWQAEVEAAGGLYLLAENLEDVVEGLK